MAEFTPEFENALRHVVKDFHIGPHQTDLVAVGVNRTDCLSLLEFCTEGCDFAIGAAVAMQWAVAVGVWIERARWESQATGA